MTIKFYESPFHAIEESEVASKSVLKADLTIMIRDIIENRGLTQKESGWKVVRYSAACIWYCQWKNW
jgi:predicted XRE-type DNA-binding protein